MLRNSGPLPWKILFPHNKFLIRSPLPRTLPPEKITVKKSENFPITNSICNQWAKLVTCSPSPGDSGGLSHVTKIDNGLKNSSSSRPDSIPTKVVKSILPSIVVSLTKLISLSFKCGVFRMLS